ncbi:hypothetical protein [Natranaerobius trueperi]|uniref:Uncharacterized protein n=1 Tax=Natranaerobius trueperi TaxID=759412 RepID=A0A226BVH6_9FIRM|nr:hypothetical protein [Natranaerobius trueperi]OWZ82993.1 hypothetical protein CDO51_10860 [Natranaerobius trueperi]
MKTIKKSFLLLFVSLLAIMIIGCQPSQNVELTEEELDDKLEDKYQKGIEEGEKIGYKTGYEDALEKTLGGWFNDHFETGYYIVKIKADDHTKRYKQLRDDNEMDIENTWFIHSRTEMISNTKYEVDEDGTVWGHE